MAQRTPKKTKSLLDAPPARSSRTVFFASVAAVAVHVLAAAGALTASASRDRGHEIAALVSEAFEVEVEVEPPPPPPPPAPKVEEPPPPPKPVAKPEPIKEPDPPPPEPTPEPPPAAAPAAAQAAQVLTQEPKDEVLDFGETIVQGDSAQYAGGVTEAGGMSAKAVRNTNARAGGIEGGTGTDTSGLDRSRPAALAGGTYWDCPFPEEADDEGIDDAVVTLRVRVAVDGTLQDVQVTRDPGAGFGREARRCARGKRWQPARDRAGNAITSHSMISVRFSR